VNLATAAEFQSEIARLQAIIAAQEAKIEQLRAERRWIPVSERLPEPQIRVLLSRPPEHRQDTVRIMRLIGGGYEQYWVDSNGLTSPLHAYSHWMPLPCTPSEGSVRTDCIDTGEK
jgi:hypothetical protein